MGRSDVAIIIPAYNEEETIAEVVREVSNDGMAIVVNDASSDETATRADQAGAVVVNHTENAGYDAALDSGFAKAAELGCRYAVTIDADGQHDPALIGECLRILEGSSDMVLGVRNQRRLLSEHLFAWVTRFRFGIQDPLCGLKGYRMSVYDRLGYFDSYKSIGTELALFGARNGFTFSQLPVLVREREGRSRFGSGIRPNWQVLRSLVRSLLPAGSGVACERRVLTSDARDPSSDENLMAELRDFFRTAGKNALAVSLLPAGSPIESLEEVFHWRAVFGDDEDFRLWTDAYCRLDEIVATLPPSIAGVVTTNYHECARDLFQALVIRQCDRRLNAPIVFVVPAYALPLIADLGSSAEGIGSGAVTLALMVASTGIVGAFRTVRNAIGLVAHMSLHPVLAVAEQVGVQVRGEKKATGYELIFRVRLRLPRYSDLASFVRFLADGASTSLAAVSVTVKSARLHLGRQVRRLMRFIGGPRIDESQTRPEVSIITVEDSGTGVNLRPALRILDECVRTGEPVIVLSSYDTVVDEVRVRGGRAVNVFEKLPRPSLSVRGLGKARITTFMRRYPRPSPERLFLLTLRFRLGSYLRSIRAAESAMKRIEKTSKVTAVLTIYESLPLSVTAGLWAQNRNVPWIGFFPILVGERPDGNHFPAPLHLVYGDQLRDKMIAYGCDPASIAVVGTPTFDITPRRNLGADRTYVWQRFPEAMTKKLVVVVTEAFSLPLVELEPIILSLARMEDVAVVVKVHPSDSLDFYEAFIASVGQPDNVAVVQNCDLLALLNIADLLMAILSNVIVTAAALGTPTLVCDFSGKSKVVDFVAEGLCSGCYEPDQVHQTIRSLLFNADARQEALNRLVHVKRFNGPNDGRSHERVVAHLHMATTQVAGTGQWQAGIGVAPETPREVVASVPESTGRG